MYYFSLYQIQRRGSGDDGCECWFRYSAECYANNFVRNSLVSVVFCSAKCKLTIQWNTSTLFSSTVASDFYSRFTDHRLHSVLSDGNPARRRCRHINVDITNTTVSREDLTRLPLRSIWLKVYTNILIENLRQHISSSMFAKHSIALIINFC